MFHKHMFFFSYREYQKVLGPPLAEKKVVYGTLPYLQEKQSVMFYGKKWLHGVVNRLRRM